MRMRLIAVLAVLMASIPLGAVSIIKPPSLSRFRH